MRYYIVEEAELQALDGPLLDDSGAQSFNLRVALMDVRRGRPVDQQTEQFGATIVTARVHDSLAGIDLGKVMPLSAGGALENSGNPEPPDFHFRREA